MVMVTVTEMVRVRVRVRVRVSVRVRVTVTMTVTVTVRGCQSIIHHHSITVCTACVTTRPNQSGERVVIQLVGPHELDMPVS